MKPLILCPCAVDDAKPAARYENCCGRWLDTSTPAPHAQALMQSRYTAFVLERADYLLATWHSNHRPPGIQFEAGVKWLGLKVRSHRLTGASTAEVEFVARQRPAIGAAVRLHERSRFMLEEGRWLYLDGDVV